MNRLAPGLIVGILAALVILAMLVVPSASTGPTAPNGAANGSVVTADVKALDASLGRLKQQVEAGRLDAARAELAGLEQAWQGLLVGLDARGLADGAPSLAFGESLSRAKGAASGDRASAIEAQKSLTAAFAKVKADLQGTTVVDLRQLALSLGGILLLWLGGVLGTRRLVGGLGLKG